MRVIVRAWREQADGRAARTLRYGVHGMHSDTLTADVTADDMAILELLTFSMAGDGDEMEARQQARLGAWARSAVPAGSQGRAMLMHMRLVEAGRYLTARRKRMPDPKATHDTRVTRPCNRVEEGEARAMAQNAVHWAGEAGPRCKAEQDRADWAARSRCTNNPDENTFRSGRDWTSRPVARARDRESGDGGEGWEQPKRSCRAAAPAAAPEIALENAFEPLQDLQEDHASESGESAYWSAHESAYESAYESTDESAYEGAHEGVHWECEDESAYESACESEDESVYESACEGESESMCESSCESVNADEDAHEHTWGVRKRSSEIESESESESESEAESEGQSESGASEGEGGSAGLGLANLAAMLATITIEVQPTLQQAPGSRPAKRSAEMNGEEQDGARRKGARVGGPEHADEAVKSGGWRVFGWEKDGSERLAPIWQIDEDKFLRPRVRKIKRKFGDG